jgi:hypothetical protein
LRCVVRAAERAPFGAPVAASTSSSISRSAAKASISRTRSPSASFSTSSRRAILSSVIVVSGSVQGLATRTFSEDRRWPPASPPAARCATPGAPRAAGSYTTRWDTTTGGSFAIAGHDVRDTCVTERAQALTRMYDAGEVVVGYADARNGDIVNMVVEHLMLEPEHDRATRRPIWRILVYVEEPQGHELRGVIAGATWNDAAQQMLDAVTDGLRRPLPDQRTALNRILVARSN